MTDTGLATMPVSAIGASDRVAWAEGLEVSLPQSLVENARSGTLATTVEWEEAVDCVRLAAAYTDRQPTSSRLPFSYQMIPLPVRTAIGHVLGRLQRGRTKTWAAFPRFPLDLSADFVADLCGAPPSPYASDKTPVLLSHDIDTAEGLRNLVALFLNIEESAGARSSNYVVPCGWPIDDALLEEVRRRGHEIGVHGFDHSNLTPFADAEGRRKRIDAARPLIERYGIIGYRAPSMLRTRALLDDLSTLYRYDSSIPTSGGLFPVPNNGCASARPFRIGELIEIPLSMPRDGSLMFLGYGPEEIFTMWRECAERIAASGGIVSLLTHCESRFSGSAPMLVLYRRFLEYLASDPRYAFRTPADIVNDFSPRAA